MISIIILFILGFIPSNPLICTDSNPTVTELSTMPIYNGLLDINNIQVAYGAKTLTLQVLPPCSLFIILC